MNLLRPTAIRIAGLLVVDLVATLWLTPIDLFADPYLSELVALALIPLVALGWGLHDGVRWSPRAAAVLWAVTAPLHAVAALVGLSVAMGCEALGALNAMPFLTALVTCAALLGVGLGWLLGLLQEDPSRAAGREFSRWTRRPPEDTTAPSSRRRPRGPATESGWRAARPTG